MKPFAYILLVAFIAGCTSIPTVRRYVPATEVKSEKIQNYTLGEPRTAYVGEAIIEKGNLTYTEIAEGKYRALADVAHIFSRGALYSAIFVDQNDGSIYVQGNSNGPVVGAKIDSSGRLLSSHMYYYNIGGWQDHAMTDLGKVGAQIFEPTPTTRRYSPESFKVELLYLGKSGGDIRISYREYKDDIARPAFYQELTYNLSQSDVIRYKSFRIKVSRSTNEEIEFVVVED